MEMLQAPHLPGHGGQAAPLQPHLAPWCCTSASPCSTLSSLLVPALLISA